MSFRVDWKVRPKAGLFHKLKQGSWFDIGKPNRVTQRQKRILKSVWVAVVVAMAIRVVAISFLYHDVYKPRRDYWPFGYETGRIARSIAQGKGFGNPLYDPTGLSAWMTPIYPYLLAGVFKLFGVYSKLSAFAILSLNSLFSALTCIPIFYVARRSFGRPAALWAAWAWALFPYAIYLSGSFVWENCLSALLVTVLLLLTLQLGDQPNRPDPFHRDGPIRSPDRYDFSRWAWFGYGLLWGFAALVNATTLCLLPFLGGWALYGRYRKRPRPAGWLPPAALLALAAVVMLLPWGARNYRTFHRFIPLRDNFWLEVWVGNNGRTLNWFTDAAHPSTNKIELAEYDRLGELRYMALKRRQALSFISHHPGEFLLISFRRFVYTWTGYWSFDPRYLAEEPYDPDNIFFSVPLTLLMLVGLWQVFRKARDVALPFAFAIVFYPMVYYVTHPEMRYRHVIDPEVVILAVFGTLWLISSRRKNANRDASLSNPTGEAAPSA
jgi:4-amino-4-deoxy-L-arabinose transferase-like glycosyltransferase